MSFQALLSLPLFGMALLTFIVLLTLGRKRFAAAKARSVDLTYYQLYRGDGEPDNIRQISRNLVNLFEIPVLFYVAVVLTVALRVENSALLYLAWAYVLVRYLHSFIHCTSNKVRVRFNIFIISCAILAGYWGTLFATII